MKHLFEFNIFDKLAEREEELHRDKIKKLIDFKGGQIYALQNSGDDSVVRAEIADLRRDIAGLKQKLLTPLQRKKATQQKEKTADQRFKKQLSQDRIQQKVERKFKKELTERDKIINKLVDMQYHLRPEYRKYAPKKEYQKSLKAFHDLKNEHDIKSYEIRVKKLRKLETDILLTINTLQEARQKFKELWKVVTGHVADQKARTLARKGISDLEKYYGDDAFSDLRKF